MSKLVIWDSLDIPTIREETIILWKQNITRNFGNEVSIPELIEKNADILKSRYLRWVYNLGESKLGSSNVVETLKIRDSLSYWWMTPLAEKFNFSKSPQINEAIRLMAFDMWNKSTETSKIVLVTSNHELVECFEMYCKSNNLKLEWQEHQNTKPRESLKNHIGKTLPSRIKVLIWLVRYFIKRWKYRGIGVNQWRNSKSDITFFSYFSHLSHSSMSNGKFESTYWGNLPSILKETNKQTNWLHILTDDFKMSESYLISRLIKKFNLLDRNYQNHVLLDSFLSIKIFIKTLQDWNNLQSKLMKIEKVISLIPSEQLQLWPLFRKEYEKTSYGIRTAENMLTLNLFEKACALLPKQRIGVYLFEQQPWEFSLLYSWKNFSHGKIIGTQHSTILFWDLRYFSDLQSYLNPNHYRLPMPNKIAVNGPAAFDTLIKAGYPEKDIVLTEALRYLNLSTPNLKQNLSKLNNKFLRVLVMADYLEENSNSQIRLLEESIHLLPFEIKITIKPHPSRAIKATDFPGLEFDISNEPLSDLLQHADVAYSSAATSAAVDAYYSGVPVISVINPSELNLSPLRGVSGVFYVSTPQSMIETLNNIRARKVPARDLMHFFTIDQALPKWRTLLELNVL